jgi:hypothetical protein
MSERYVIKDRWIFDTKLNKNIHSIDCYEEKSVLDIMNGQDQQIAELEEQLKGCIRPKFKVGQEIWEITPLMSWKIKRIEWHKFNGGNGDVVMEIYRLGHDGTDDYNCCIMPVDSDRFFATKEEAQAKLKELQGERE